MSDTLNWHTPDSPSASNRAAPRTLPGDRLNLAELTPSVLLDAAGEIAAAAELIPFDCPQDIGPDGRYTLLELISISNRAWVYRAVDNRFSSDDIQSVVALKISRLPPAPLDQAVLNRAVDHPHVVPVIDRGITDIGLPFCVLKWMPAGTLESAAPAASTSRPSPRRDARTLLRQMLPIFDALRSAHALGIIHCDLKPANILLDADRKPYLADFDLAHHPAIATTARRGTLAFMPPEQFDPKLLEILTGDALPSQTFSLATSTPPSDSSPPNPQTDIYALAATCLWLLTGKAPFGSDPSAIAQSLSQRTPADVTSLPRALQPTFRKALAPDPHHRFRSIADFETDIRAWLTHHAIPSRASGPLTRSWLLIRRHPLISTAAVVSVAAAITVPTALVLAKQRAIKQQLQIEQQATQLARENIENVRQIARDRIRMLFQQMTARAPSGEFEHLAPALVMIDLVSSQPFLAQHPADSIAPHQRLHIFESLLREAERKSRVPSLASVALQLGLIDAYWSLDRLPEALRQAQLLEQTSIDALAPQDPLREYIPLVRLALQAKLEPDDEHRQSLIAELDGKLSADPGPFLARSLRFRLKETVRPAPPSDPIMDMIRQGAAARVRSGESSKRSSPPVP